MAGETLKIVSNEFPKHLLSTNHDMFTNNYFADVTLVSDDETQATAHKIVLSACTPILRKLLVNNLHP